MLLESAKRWHSQHLNLSDGREKLIPRWNDAWIIEKSGGAQIVAPAPERYLNNRKYSMRRFLVFRTRGNSVEEGRIVEFLGRIIM